MGPEPDEQSRRRLIALPALADLTLAGDNLAMNVLEHSVRRPSPALLALGALSLLSAAFYVGSPGLASPWIQGDEILFIANNSDVTGENADQPALFPWLAIFTKVHEDLYQPLPVFSYAVQWWLAGPQGAAYSIRFADVILHGLTALLLWRVLSRLLASPGAIALAWAASLVWTTHPTLAPAFAADMGRTHILAALLALLSLEFQLNGLERRQNAWFAASLVMLVLAMLSKLIAGWFLVVAAVELQRTGWRASLRSWRVLAAFAICAAFSGLTWLTTRQAGLIGDVDVALFGDPLSRAALALWLYASHLVWPVNLATWYPPDVNTGWGYAPVWLGVLLAAGSVAVAATAARLGRSQAALGIVWFWAAILPLLGIVGARVAAAQDRYLYLPLMGLLLAACALLTPRARRLPPVVAVLGGLILAAMLAIPARTLTADARSTLRRAERVLARDPADPRAIEFLAMAYDFGRDRPTPEQSSPTPPDWDEQFVYTLRRAAQQAETAPQYFRDRTDRAAFHRRLSFQFFVLNDLDLALAHAKRAQEFDPESAFTWTRLAHTYRAIGDFALAADAYAELEKRLPDNPQFRALRLTEYGDLLLWRLNRPDLAGPRFAAALATGVPPIEAGIGVARCEVLAGKGLAGFEMASEILSAHPERVDAAMVIALYHLRSEDWPKAFGSYQAILGREPLSYEALRGLHEAAVRLNRPEDAVRFWENAVRLDPENPLLRPWRAWAAACAGEPTAEHLTRALLTENPRSVLAALANLLNALRAGDEDAVGEALEAALEADALLPEAREYTRAELAVRVLHEHERLGPLATPVRAVLIARMGALEQADALLNGYFSDLPNTEHERDWRQLRDLAAARAPASAPVAP